MDFVYDMKQANKDIKDLGIINIEASGDLTPGYVCDAIRAVKEINLDIDKLVEQMEDCRRNPAR